MASNRHTIDDRLLVHSSIGVDFTIVRTLNSGDTLLRPDSDAAKAHVVAYRRTFGEESCVWTLGRPAIFVETSRDASRLADTINDLRREGFVIA